MRAKRCCLPVVLIADMQHVHCLRTHLHDYFPETSECRMRWSIVRMLQIEMWRATCLFLMRRSQVGWVSELLVENRNTHTLLEDCTSDILFRWFVNALFRNPMATLHHSSSHGLNPQTLRLIVLSYYLYLFSYCCYFRLQIYILSTT